METNLLDVLGAIRLARGTTWLPPTAQEFRKRHSRSKPTDRAEAFASTKVGVSSLTDGPMVVLGFTSRRLRESQREPHHDCFRAWFRGRWPAWRAGRGRC